MAATCETCGTKLGIGRRLSGKDLCESCEDQREVAQATSLAEYQGLLAAVTQAPAGSQASTDRLPSVATNAGLDDRQQHVLKVQAMASVLRAVVDDEWLTVEEEHQILSVANALGLEEDGFREAVGPFGNRIAIARLNAGRLPVDDQPSIILKRGEVDHFEVAARMMKEVVHRETRGGYSGISIPIMKGVRFNTGAYRGKSVIVGTSLEVADEGILCITSKRAVFKGMRQTQESLFTKLVGVNVFDDGIQLHVSNRQKASTFRVTDGYLVAAVINAVVQAA